MLLNVLLFHVKHGAGAKSAACFHLSREFPALRKDRSHAFRPQPRGNGRGSAHGFRNFTCFLTMAGVERPGRRRRLTDARRIVMAGRCGRRLCI